MIYATLNNGMPTAFYRTDIHTSIPVDAVEISDDDWQAHINGAPRQYIDQQWVPSSPPFDPAAAALGQHAVINAACSIAIAAGFESSALGSPHYYDCATHDQINILGLVATGIDYPYPCRDAAGVKAERAHTAAQLKQVFSAGLAHICANTSHARALKSQLDALAADPATTPADIDAVTW